jgi:hypothetical protein
LNAVSARDTDPINDRGIAMTEFVRLEQRTGQPGLKVEHDPSGEGWCVSAHSLYPDLLASAGVDLESLLQIRVADAGAQDYDDLPNISGDYEVLGDCVRFIPHLPFEPGVSFRAILDLGALRQSGPTKVLVREFSLPRQAATAETKVSHVFPSDDVLPENLLRFYVRFSNPMQRGQAEHNVVVLGSDGAPSSDILYRAPVELWDKSMTCLTILLDPGRLKRGVGPNRVLGPPLKAGRWYALKVGAGMIDVHGRPLREDCKKPFSVSGPVREPIVVEKWDIRSPAAHSCQPLELTFPRALDWAQLWRGIAVVSESGQAISGRIDIDCGETRWRFTPDTPWQLGAHGIRIAPGLEDICGNTPLRPFDGRFRSTEEVTRGTNARLISFEVNAR